MASGDGIRHAPSGLTKAPAVTPNHSFPRSRVVEFILVSSTASHAVPYFTFTCYVFMSETSFKLPVMHGRV